MLMFLQAAGVSQSPPLQGWERFADLGVTAAFIGGLMLMFAKVVFPRLMAQHEGLTGDLLKAFREESTKAREYHERLVETHEKMFADEREHHSKLVNMLVEEWKLTRAQLHEDAKGLQKALRDIKRAKGVPTDDDDDDEGAGA